MNEEITVKAPTRISLFGGSTDIEPFSSLYGGACINMAIDVYQEYILTPQLGNSETWFDGETRSGLGSSGSYFACFIAAHTKANDIYMDKNQIAEAAYKLEHDVLRKPTGRQDHYAAVYGGFNLMEFHKEGVTITPLPNGQKVADYLVLIYTGKPRTNLRIQSSMTNLSSDRLDYLFQMMKNVKLAHDLIKSGNIVPLGTILENQWEIKIKSNPAIQTSEIEELYRQGQVAGARSGKLLGAGGGGYMVFFVEPSKRLQFIQTITDLDPSYTYVPFKIDKEGLKIK